MKEKYYLISGSKRVMGWSVKILVIILLIGISSRIYANKISRYVSSGLSAMNIPYSTTEIVLPGSNTELDLSSPSSTEKSIGRLLKEIEHMINTGL